MAFKYKKDFSDPEEVEPVIKGEDVMEGKEDLQELYERSVEGIEEGEIVRGRVLSVGEDYVIVDIGYKSEGRIPLREFLDEDGRIEVREGDEVDVFLERKEGREGFAILSKAKADRIKMWDTIEEAYRKGGIVRGRVVQRVKGGYTVDLKGVRAFLPGSLADTRPTERDTISGKTSEFKVIKVDRRRGNIVLSRKALLEERRERLLESLKEGQVVEGIVKNITDYGVFVDLGGIDGLLHVNDISWGRVSHPSRFFAPGERIKAKVLKCDRESGRISLGFKQLKPDPWIGIEERYPPGSKVKGRVTGITDYGLFVEIEDGVEGLVHLSELSWAKRVRHPSHIASVGDHVDVVVLSVSEKERRLSLSLKRARPNPWDLLVERYRKGDVVTGKVSSIADFGIFVELEEGVEGLVHVSDVSWDREIKDLSEIFSVGDEVSAVILNMDRKNERLSLGIKQLEHDPWKDVEERYKPGMVIRGKVTNVTDFGAFVEIEPGLEGLVHISEMRNRRFRSGDEVNVEILNIDPTERKMGLGLRKEG